MKNIYLDPLNFLRFQSSYKVLHKNCTMKYFTLFFTFTLFFGSNSFSQSMKVTGTVYDTTGVTTLDQASIMAVRLKDSILLGLQEQIKTEHLNSLVLLQILSTLSLNIQTRSKIILHLRK